MPESLKSIEAVYNAFCGVVDDIDTFSAKNDGLPLRKDIAASALFTFEASTNDRVFELAKQRGNTAPLEEVVLPFDKVTLVDDIGVVHLQLLGEADEGAVLRRFSAVVYLKHLHTDDKHWMVVASTLTHVNLAALPEGAKKDGFVCIDPRAENSVHLLNMSDPVVTIINDGGTVLAKQLPQVQPAMRGAEVPPQPSEHDVAAFVLRDFVTSVTSAIEQLWYINLPRHHVIEAIPRHVADNIAKYERQAKAKTPRFADRIRYLLVEPEKVREIRPRGEDSGGTHASPAPHMRAGYSKILRAERFKKRRWAVVHVRPTWVGDEAWDNGKIRYRVVAPGTKL